MTGTITNIANEAEKSANMVADAATNVASDVGKQIDPSQFDKAEGAIKSFLDRAQSVIEDAVETTVEAIKEHPVAAAAIAGGVAATVAGAAYGVSKLVSGEEAPAAKPAPKAKPKK